VIICLSAGQKYIIKLSQTNKFQQHLQISFFHTNFFLNILEFTFIFAATLDPFPNFAYSSRHQSIFNCIFFNNEHSHLRSNKKTIILVIEFITQRKLTTLLFYIVFISKHGDKVVLWTVWLFFTVCGLEKDLLLPRLVVADTAKWILF
jgi:hypothetical protein